MKMKPKNERYRLHSIWTVSQSVSRYNNNNNRYTYASTAFTRTHTHTHMYEIENVGRSDGALKNKTTWKTHTKLNKNLLRDVTIHTYNAHRTYNNEDDVGNEELKWAKNKWARVLIIYLCSTCIIIVVRRV